MCGKLFRLLANYTLKEITSFFNHFNVYKTLTQVEFKILF